MAASERGMTFRLDGFEEEYADNRLRSETDAGPAKVRRRTSQNVGLMRGSMVLDAAQKAAFDTFFETTLLGGVLQFDFPDPAGGVLQVRFGEKIPTVARATPDLSLVSMEFEVLP